MGVTDADFAPRRFSTEGVAEHHRLPRWREEFGRALVGVDIKPLSPEAPLQAEAVMQALPGLRIALCNGTAMHYEHKPTIATESDGAVWLIVNMGTTAMASQRGTSLALTTGDAVAVLTDEPGELTCTSQLGIVFPRTVLATRIEDFSSAIMRIIPSSMEPLRMLVSYITMMQDQFTLGTPELRQTFVHHIHDLAALALGAKRDTPQRALNALASSRLGAALADIRKNFVDPALTLADVAHRQDVSPRYLQRLLERSGMSFTAHVNELRLQRAFRLLSGPHNRTLSIAEISWQAGFSSVSHFNRLFRARFGDTPTGIRA